MVKRYYGGLISATPTVVNSSSASGIFNTNQQLQARQTGSWPSVLAPPPPPTPQYLWGWGYNAYGQIGDETTTNRSSPVQVGSDTTWSIIDAGGPNCLAVKTDGTMWAWGRNNNANLGLGDTSNRSSPVQIGAISTWSTVSAGLAHSAAIKDGQLWTWGNNNSGGLGLGDTTNRSSPTQVGGLANWLKVSAGNYLTAAITTTGQLWTWGAGGFGQLGLGNTTSISSPAQVGTLETWSSVSAGNSYCIGIKEGQMWSWGGNYAFKLGLSEGDDAHKSSPTQVGALTNWANVSVTNANHTSMAVKTTGTLWGWGKNSYGELGLGSTGNVSSPTQVGAREDWAKVAVGNSSSHGITTTGQLWSWGRNGYGRLALGDSGNSAPFNRSSPVQVGTDTTWLSVTAGRYAASALKT